MPGQPVEKSTTNPYTVHLTGLPNFPEINEGADITSLLIASIESTGLRLMDGDLFVLAHKIISKAEGRVVDLKQVVPGKRAIELAEESEKDPRLVELILQESSEISRIRRGLIIVRHRLGFTSANAGIDRSNVPQGEEEELVLLLPEDPDGTAERLQKEIQDRIGKHIGIIIVDSHGRPFRLGTVGVAIGVAGVVALWDRRGETDRYGYELQHTEVGTADEIAAAASLLMGQADEGTPVVHISGLQLPIMAGRAQDLVRPPSIDLYR